MLIDAFGLGVLDLAELNVMGVLGLAGPNVTGALNRVGSKIGKTPVADDCLRFWVLMLSIWICFPLMMVFVDPLSSTLCLVKWLVYFK